ncbi:hypothetical protein [Photobacterium lutimaris]|uniref:Uncharacterized protein n=1 Tax=Photobacterium lutimaris TaxID=388278 RepID=A0A2T3IZG5_9GAMM|nr:hypothetical protein [Photobacterium lutimaris]PSU34045.1 hypothetical protein C9I99_11855 [Photobacterium lutimaris]TDR76388.1 hypothetical protein DFP78_103385 [Photobacterium lutimaris]
MAERLKRINYSIYLDPLNNPADLYASKVLHQWADDFTRLKAESGEESGLALLNARNVQKQVYLSGLFMHLLSPELSQQLSLQVTESQVSEFTLEKTLHGLGFLVTKSEPKVSLQAQSELLEVLKASIGEQLRAEAELTRDHISSSISSAAAEKPASGDAGMGGVDGIYEQNEKLVSMLELQSKQIAELKQKLVSQAALIRAIPTGNIGSQSVSTNNDSPVVDLNERLAHVQKIKKKGIF